MTLSWRRDGDQWVAAGTLGEYRIAEWRLTRGGSNFVLIITSNAEKGKAIAQSSSLENAQWQAQTYDGYRSRPRATPRQQKQAKAVSKILSQAFKL